MEVWFHAKTPVIGAKCKVFDADGNKIHHVASYEVFSRTAILYVQVPTDDPTKKKYQVKDGKIVTETKVLEGSYLELNGVRY